MHVWTQNGIEWYCPMKHVAAAFKCSEADLAGVDLAQERITVNALTHTKVELAQFVVARMTLDDYLPWHFDLKFGSSEERRNLTSALDPYSRTPALPSVRPASRRSAQSRCP